MRFSPKFYVFLFDVKYFERESFRYREQRLINKLNHDYKVRPFIKKNIRKYLQKAGIHIQPMPSPEHFHESLKYHPDGVQRFELKRIAGSVRIAENHAYYERLLNAFVPS
jgi:hypothetical protein